MPPPRDVDTGFLANVAAVCRDRGILLVYDEIMPGFRYRKGSAPQATGVVPNLTCPGKALTSDWPLSALIGRREVMEPTMGRVYYHLTFKDEVYSFAAAFAARGIDGTVVVPGHVHAFGPRLTEAVTRVSAEIGTRGLMVGLPYRMGHRFDEPDIGRRALKGTLLVRELRKRGIRTFRVCLLPSLGAGRVGTRPRAGRLPRVAAGRS